MNARLTGRTYAAKQKSDGSYKIKLGEIYPQASKRYKVQGGDDAYYTLDGRKLNGKPTQKGVFIHQGNTYINK